MDQPSLPFNLPLQTNYLCDKASCFHSTVNALSLDDACCYGHHLSDKMLSYDAVTGQTVYVGPTNEEVLVMGDPTSATYSMPYIYSNFEWDHCQEIKVDINSLLDKLAYTNMQDPTYTSTTTTTTTTTTMGPGGKTIVTPVTTTPTSTSAYSTYSKWFASITTVTKPEPIIVTPAPAELPNPVTTSQPMGGSEAEVAGASEAAGADVAPVDVVPETTPETEAVEAAGSAEAGEEKKTLWKTLVSWLLSPFGGRGADSVQAAEVGVIDAAPAVSAPTAPVMASSAVIPAAEVPAGVKTGVMPVATAASAAAVSSSVSVDVMPDIIAAVDSVKIDHTVVSSDSSDTDSGATDNTTPSVADVLPDVIAAVDSVKIDHVDVKAEGTSTTATATATATASTTTATATATTTPAAATTTATAAAGVAPAPSTTTASTTTPLPDAGVVADIPIGTTAPRAPKALPVVTATPATSTVTEDKVTEVAARVSLKLGTITSIDPHAHTTTATATTEATAEATAESRRLRHR